MRVLAPQNPLDRAVELLPTSASTRRGLLPERIAELLCRVRMTEGDGECAAERVVVDPAPRCLEPLADERSKGLGSDNAKLHVPCASPERLVGVPEEALHHASLATEIDVGDVRLRLKDR